MEINGIDLSENVFVVAEIGNNHEGNFQLAQEMLGRAAEAGVNAVKFQTFIPELYISRTDTERLDRLRRFRLSQDQFTTLANQARELGVAFFSTPFDLLSAKFLNDIQSIFKVSSGDNNFYPLIETIAAFGKPTIISTGLADLTLLDKIYELWSQKFTVDNLIFLHCVASYPVPMTQANLGAIHTLQKRYSDLVIGYSDHTVGIDAATYAVAAGARLIEKHFTIDKNYSSFRDHQLSADPQDMRRLVDAVRQVNAVMGGGHKVVQACEEELRIAARRSIAASRNLNKDAVISYEDLAWVRPGTGISPGNEWKIVNRKLKRCLKQGDLISLTDLV